MRYTYKDKHWFRVQLRKLDLKTFEEKEAWLDKAKRWLIQEGLLTHNKHWFTPEEILEIFNKEEH
jgi:hypothetical protein